MSPSIPSVEIGADKEEKMFLRPALLTPSTKGPVT
jgi:hypothetical protein